MKGRTRKQQRIDTKRHYASLAELSPEAKAAKAFFRKAYEIAPGIREVEHESVDQYVRRKTGGVIVAEKEHPGDDLE